jgi:hypothetical protein
MKTLTDLASAADESAANEAVIPNTNAIVVAAFPMVDAPQEEVVFHQSGKRHSTVSESSNHPRLTTTSWK